MENNNAIDVEIIQPQWVYDCVNTMTLLPAQDYAVGSLCPPHLSPFVRDSETGYVPEQRKRLEELVRQARENKDNAKFFAEKENNTETNVEEESDDGEVDSEEEEEEMNELEEQYKKELEEERKGKEEKNKNKNKNKNKKNKKMIEEVSDDDESEDEDEDEDESDSEKEEKLNAEELRKRKRKERRKSKQEEEDELAEIMLPKKKRRLYQRATHSISTKQSKAENLRQKAKQIKKSEQKKKK